MVCPSSLPPLPYKWSRFSPASVCAAAPLPLQSFCLLLWSSGLRSPIFALPPVKYSLSIPTPPPDLLHHHPRPSMDPWLRSDVLHVCLEGLVKKGLLCSRTVAMEWIVPSGEDEPSPPDGYVVSFVPFHEHGFMTPPHRFVRGLLHYYGLEL